MVLSWGGPQQAMKALCPRSWFWAWRAGERRRRPSSTRATILCCDPLYAAGKCRGLYANVKGRRLSSCTCGAKLRAASLAFNVRGNRFKPRLTSWLADRQCTGGPRGHRRRRMVSNARSARSIHFVNWKMKTIHLNDIKSPYLRSRDYLNPTPTEEATMNKLLRLGTLPSRSDLLHRIRPNDNAGRPSRPNGKGDWCISSGSSGVKTCGFTSLAQCRATKEGLGGSLLSRFIRGRHVGCARLRPEGRAASEQLRMFGMMVARRRLRDHRPSRAIIARFAAMQRRTVRMHDG